MLDPNLEKIRDFHLEEIKQGKLGIAIEEAEDYLSYILGFRAHRIKKELATFAKHIRQLSNQYKKGKNNGQEEIQTS